MLHSLSKLSHEFHRIWFLNYQGFWFLTTIINVVNSYINRFKEDIKNIDRLSNEIGFFIELINIKLAEKRNNYAFKSLRLEMLSCSYSLSCFLIYMFGTNLKSSLEEDE